ncbi:13236_t:CDS:2 [Gigaspora rosea]|nr:13236_t:CDS:2 [Gigaspora rosea]
MPKTRCSTKSETREYIRTRWISEDFLPEDLKSTKVSQPYTLSDPEFTFIEKFLKKREQRRLSRNDLLVMDAMESEIFSNNGSLNSSSAVWREFGLWAYFPKIPDFNKCFHHHCRRLWSKVNHAHREAQKKNAESEEFEGYYHVFNPQCFRNSFDEVVVDFFDLVKPTGEEDTIAVVDKYYSHNLNKDNKLHKSKEFKKGLVEHFGAFTGNNNEPYTTANTASNHCSEHRKCVRELISGLQPLSNAVNSYLQETYPALYTKMAKLDLGPNVPKSFGAFPTIAINFNVISQFHRDLKDHRNTLCVVCPLGIFKGGQLMFPELKLIIHAREGQAITFRSNILVHGNLPVIAGIRHSVVFFIHATSIKQNRKFGTLFRNTDPDNSDSEINDHMNNNKLGASKKRTKQNKKRSKTSKSGSRSRKVKNSRRSYLDLEPAKKGLPAKYKI